MKTMHKVATFEEWTKIEAYGTYEDDFRNGEVWSWNGELYYLAFIELPFAEQRKLLESK